MNFIFMKDFYPFNDFIFIMVQLFLEICVTTSTLGSNPSLMWDKGATKRESNMHDDLMAIR
jgi:hypothetical protein